MKKEEKAVPVGVEDFSQQAVGKAVLSNTLQHPLTLYPVVLGVLGAAAAVILDFPFTVLLGSSSAMGGGVMNWIVNFFFRGDAFAKRYIQGRQEAVALQRTRLLETMQAALMQCRSIAGAEELSGQGVEQLEQIQGRLGNLQEILAGKVDRHELIYSRFLGVAEQVYLSVLDNLGDVLPILKGVSAIDTEYISRRLNELRQLENPADVDREEVATLMKRKALRDQQLQRVNVLLTRNEEAMTQMDDATAAVANMDTDEARASLDLETAIEELQRLAGVARQFK
jgi:hypothetical protein